MPVEALVIFSTQDFEIFKKNFHPAIVKFTCCPRLLGRKASSISLTNYHINTMFFS